MNILRRSSLSQTLAIAVFALGYNPSFADTILESATLGPTGQRTGTGIANIFYPGARFSTSVEVQVTAIGGHMFGNAGSSFFGAIVRMPPGAFALPT